MNAPDEMDYGSGFSSAMYRTDYQNPLRRIIRLQSDLERTWRVTVRRFGRIVERTFSDASYGGKRQSLAAAKIYRDAVEVYIATFEADHRLWRSARKNRRNTSGTVGVARYVHPPKKPGGQPFPFWQAFWVDMHGKRQSKSFLVGAHGEHGARRLALQAHARGLADVHAELQRAAPVGYADIKPCKELESILFAAAFVAESLRP
ncbi:hypothetical protein [Polaromonas sp. YR568]|uniref:hypothetical protein n=1 Tax=Polaromonas sp. YR568 TaxID=1855301 RepID=UPI00398C069C